MQHERIEPRVLHVDTEQTWRGGEQQMLYLLQGLAQRGLAARAVCQPGSPAADRCRQSGVHVREVAMRGEGDLAAALKIAMIARRTKSNIIHCHTAHAHALAWSAVHVWMAPCRLVVHRRIEFPVGRSAFGLGMFKYRFGVDAFVAVSNHVKEVLVQAGVPDWKVFPVHSATDPQRFSSCGPNPALRSTLGIPEDAFVVGNIGFLVGHKDHNTLLEASRIVRDEIPNLWVVIVGEGPLREKILSKADSLHMDDRVILTGFRDDIPQLIRMFDLFALSSSEEGICSTLLDAMASGCPIVTTDAGGVREAIVDGETGLVVPVKSPLALARAILQMAGDAPLARLMASRGQQRARRLFTADALTERTLRVYRMVLAGSVRP